MASRNRGKPKVTLGNLSRVTPTSEERKAVREALRQNESPIATAILGATIVEFELEAELRTRFRRQDDDVWKEMTQDIGPLSTFNQKIIAAYAFGVLNDVTRSGINTIRNIRNQFAHSKRLLEFDHPLIVRELKLVKRPEGKRTTLYKRLTAVREMADGPRSSYSMLCLILGLEIIKKRTTRVSAANRARLNRRRKALLDALQRAPLTSGLGLLGSLAGNHTGGPSGTTPYKGLLYGLGADDIPHGK